MNARGIDNAFNLLIAHKSSTQSQLMTGPAHSALTMQAILDPPTTSLSSCVETPTIIFLFEWSRPRELSWKSHSPNLATSTVGHNGLSRGNAHRHFGPDHHVCLNKLTTILLLPTLPICGHPTNPPKPKPKNSIAPTRSTHMSAHMRLAHVDAHATRIRHAPHMQRMSTTCL